MTIETLRGLVEQATPTPWGHDSCGMVRGDDKRFPGEALGQFVRLPPGFSNIRRNVPDDFPQANSNMDAVIAAVNALPALLAVAEAARKVVKHTADFDLETALARLDGEVG